MDDDDFGRRWTCLKTDQEKKKEEEESTPYTQFPNNVKGSSSISFWLAARLITLAGCCD